MEFTINNFIRIIYFSGSEKDEAGFYFKGDTSVPSYHKTDNIQWGCEYWDDDGNSVKHDSNDDFHSGCRNIGQCLQQQSFSGLLSPGRSNHRND